MCLNLSTRPHSQGLLPFLQCPHSGLPSSHLRWRPLHVKQPVRDLFAEGFSVVGPGSLLMMVSSPSKLLTGDICISISFKPGGTKLVRRDSEIPTIRDFDGGDVGITNAETPGSPASGIAPSRCVDAYGDGNAGSKNPD